MVLSLDFEKCFNKVEKTALIGSLEYFQFSTYIIKWANIIYGDFEAKVQNNSFFTNSFKITKGI